MLAQLVIYLKSMVIDKLDSLPLFWSRGQLTNLDDVNNCLAPGFYHYYIEGGIPANLPQSFNRGILIVFNCQGVHIGQLIIEYSNTTTLMAFRLKVYGFSSWKVIN